MIQAFSYFNIALGTTSRCPEPRASEKMNRVKTEKRVLVRFLLLNSRVLLLLPKIQISSFCCFTKIFILFNLLGTPSTVTRSLEENSTSEGNSSLSASNSENRAKLMVGFYSRNHLFFLWCR